MTGPVRVSRAEDVVFVAIIMQHDGAIMRVSAALNIRQARELAGEINLACDEIRAEYS